MIEIIYESGEQKNQSRPPRLPKNIVQIGQPQENRKIYIEEKTRQYLQNIPVRENEVAFGVLLGTFQRYADVSYLFINGLIVADPTDNMVDFNMEAWNGIYEDLHTYFPEGEIVGWYLSIPYRIPNDMGNLLKIHLDNFGGAEKVCYFADRKEKDAGMYFYQDGVMKGEKGYYVYQCQNDQIQKYLDEKGLYGLKLIYPQKEEQGIKGGIIERNGQKQKSGKYKIVALIACFLAIAMALATILKFGSVKKLNQNIREIMAFEQTTGANNVDTEWTGKTQVKNVAGNVTQKKGTDTASDAATKQTDQATTSAEACYYTVQKGENLFEICIKIYNDIGMLEELKVVNGLDDNATIHEGDKLLLP